MKNSSKSRYGEIANLYDAVLSLSRFRRGIEIFLKEFEFGFMPPDARILDMGCGTGTASLSLARQFPESTIYACDLDVKMLRKLKTIAERKGIGSERFIVAQADLKTPHLLRVIETEQVLNLPDGYFDFIITSAALEHAPLPETAACFHKLLKPSGVFLNIGMKENSVGKILGKVYDFTPHPVAIITSACKEAGFRRVAPAKLFPRHFPANLSRMATIAEK